MTDPQILTEEEYLAANGAVFTVNAAFHEPGWGGNKTHRRRLTKHEDKLWRDTYEKRVQLRKEYQEKVGAGEIRPPTNVEMLIQSARGSEDNESTHAARRVLQKRGIEWMIQTT